MASSNAHGVLSAHEGGDMQRTPAGLLGGDHKKSPVAVSEKSELVLYKAWCLFRHILVMYLYVRSHMENMMRVLYTNL